MKWLLIKHERMSFVLKFPTEGRFIKASPLLTMSGGRERQKPTSTIHHHPCGVSIHSEIIKILLFVIFREMSSKTQRQWSRFFVTLHCITKFTTVFRPLCAVSLPKTFKAICLLSFSMFSVFLPRSFTFTCYHGFMWRRRSALITFQDTQINDSRMDQTRSR